MNTQETLPPERVAELTEALCRLEGHPRLEFVIQDQHYAAQALAPLIGGWLAKAEWGGATGVAKQAMKQAPRTFQNGYEAGKRDGAAEVRTRLREITDATVVCTRHGETLREDECRECFAAAQIRVYDNTLRAALVTEREEGER